MASHHSSPLTDNGAPDVPLLKLKANIRYFTSCQPIGIENVHEYLQVGSIQYVEMYKAQLVGDDDGKPVEWVPRYFT